MSTTVGFAVALLAAVSLGGVLVWRLKSGMDPIAFGVVLGMLGLSHVVGLFVWVAMKGFSVLGFVVILAMGYGCVLVGSWGNPVEFFELMIDEQKRWSARAWLVQMRFVGVVLVVVFASLPLLLRIV